MKRRQPGPKRQPEAKAAAEAAEARRKADEEARRQAELAAAREAQMKAEADAAALKAKAEAARSKRKRLLQRLQLKRRRMLRLRRQRPSRKLSGPRRRLQERRRNVHARRRRKQSAKSRNSGPSCLSNSTASSKPVTRREVSSSRWRTFCSIPGKFDLRPTAREKLARLSGIVLAHPGLMLQVEGHTDSTGGDELNQTLSERRAGATRDYLIKQGLAEATITAAGFGETMPVADNSTAGGRQKNRRVEIIVGGEVIGAKIGK